MGERLSTFQVPVCNLFREKIVDGQVCYEADVNSFKKESEGNWEDDLQKGFGLIIDTNDEYDAKKLFKKETEENDGKSYKRIFKNTENEDSFRILLKTISKTI